MPVTIMLDRRMTPGATAGRPRDGTTPGASRGGWFAKAGTRAYIRCGHRVDRPEEHDPDARHNRLGRCPAGDAVAPPGARPLPPAARRRMRALRTLAVDARFPMRHSAHAPGGRPSSDRVGGTDARTMAAAGTGVAGNEEDR